jgi:hypothetical protein
MADLTGRGADFLEFWRERRLATLSTVRRDGTPHTVPVGVTLDAEVGLAWVITSGDSHKARQVLAAGPAGAAVAICQVDGRRYAERYRIPRVNPRRVVLEIRINRVLGNL